MVTAARVPRRDPAAPGDDRRTAKVALRPDPHLSHQAMVGLLGGPSADGPAQVNPSRAAVLGDLDHLRLALTADQCAMLEDGVISRLAVALLQLMDPASVEYLERADLLAIDTRLLDRSADGLGRVLAELHWTVLDLDTRAVWLPWPLLVGPQPGRLLPSMQGAVPGSACAGVLAAMTTDPIRRTLADAAAWWRTGTNDGGSWIHGDLSGGNVIVAVVAAHQTWGGSAHLTAAREMAAALVDQLPDDPWQWPSGLLGTDGVAGLFVGMSGTALTLARLVHPDAGLSSAALFGVA